ncbi:hypothetical protein HOG16_00790 [Candidatus Woesearchaeota archaeon]|nr:hypothetical protein [Candidatus Woesearchaeota archaeon]MBT4322111.1 hypothetical protein [Candidatus Woesearchaeota archaeon]MBT4630688.1 hypothetical protein [Candidatus Woesearchaeota archaeon]
MEIKKSIEGFEKIFHNNQLLAIVVRDNFNEAGPTFFTEQEHGFQLAVHNVEKGKRYKAHISLPFKTLENLNPNKVYFMKKGKSKIDLYDNEGLSVGEMVLNQGDLILFISGGHGCDILDDSFMIELKQGPYRGIEDDKKFLENS